MTFEDVISDLKTLKGKRLSCIGRGLDVYIIFVDIEEERIELENPEGRRTSRSFKEMRKVWEELCTQPAVHVDSALRGSGSSRNQPETLYANLPYIEYLYINNKKHIALVNSKTHAPGTIQQMDAIQAEKIRLRLRHPERKESPPSALIIVEDIQQRCTELEKYVGLKPESVVGIPGVYKIYKDENRLLIVEQRRLNQMIPEGGFVIVTGKLLEGEPFGLVVDGFEFLKPTCLKHIIFCRPLD